MKKKFKRCILLFTDTNSLCYECDEDFYIKFYKHKELSDLRINLKILYIFVMRIKKYSVK